MDMSQGEVIDPVRRALEYYTDMQKALEEGKKKEKEKDTGPKQNGITSK